MRIFRIGWDHLQCVEQDLAHIMPAVGHGDQQCAEYFAQDPIARMGDTAVDPGEPRGLAAVAWGKHSADGPPHLCTDPFAEVIVTEAALRWQNSSA